MRHLKATVEMCGGGVSVGGARRWSTATQSITGAVSTTSHQSLHLNNTGLVAGEEARKISFVLQGDQDNESIGSSKNSLSGAVSFTRSVKLVWTNPCLWLLHQLACCYQSTGCCCDLMVRDTLAISARVRSWRLLVLKHSFYITQRTEHGTAATTLWLICHGWTLNMVAHNSTG